MKKIIILVLILSIILTAMLTALTGCGAKAQGASDSAEPIVIKVGATPVPHAEILNLIKPLLEKQNIKLEIVEFQDYVQPNTALADKELDANFFQHQPYLDSFNKERSLSLVSAGKVHVEPLGLYSKKIKQLSELQAGASIAIPNDPSNAARALLLLQENRLITLKAGAGIEATEKDIVENPKALKIQLIEAAQLPRVLEDVDAAVINTNYALPANLNPVKDAIIIEGKDSPYANILVVRAGDQDRPEIKALVKALNSEDVRRFIEEKYEGAIVTAF